MATLTIRNVPEDVKTELRIAAARRGVSMEQEARERLAGATAAEPSRRKATADEIMAFVRSMPKGQPTNERYATLSQKEIADLVSDGEL